MGMKELELYYVVKFAGVGPRVYAGMPLPLSRKGAVARRAGHPPFNVTA